MDALAGHLAANVKQLRTARGFTQQQMARLSGCLAQPGRISSRAAPTPRSP